MNQPEQKNRDFDAIRLRLASPEVIHEWSHGEVLKPETINYRTQKPEKDGLFCERIFGPSKDWECYCGKYKKIRYKGIVCDKCGVEITRVLVRRERMGHIDLASPVSHIWFLRGVPSSIGLALDISVQSIEKVIYFANFIITDVKESEKKKLFEELHREYLSKKKSIESQFSSNEKENAEEGNTKKENQSTKETKLRELDELFRIAEHEIEDLRPMKIISEGEYREFSLKYGHVFDANIGAVAIYELLRRLDINEEIKQLEKSLSENKNQSVHQEKVLRRLRFFSNLRHNKIRPEWMVLTSVPIIPPDLRPMVPLDGGRFATSDLNDLYRRVINRNNRLKQLVELNAPEVIVRNERRMLQEAVDALLDNNARHGKAVMAATGQKRNLKSLADMLKGKQGRFRQNLLGKRIDYSGRSVIVIGPSLKLHECGLPKQMALELFKPFIISKLIQREIVHNVRSASRYIESGKSEVWDILEEVVSESHVLLNRAPTLHRLGIQAFKPVLIEGKAIRIHPMVCIAFNADFDGDQMAVHVPLTKQARWEAENIMLSRENLLKPATGEPIVLPEKDMVWGIYYLTYVPENERNRDKKSLRILGHPKEAFLAYQMNRIGLEERILVLATSPKMKQSGQRVLDTTVGRIIFNDILPEELPFYNETLTKKELKKIITFCLETCGKEKTVLVLDRIKEVSFAFLTRSGLSWGIGDLPSLVEKQEIVQKADEEVREAHEQYAMGLLTNEERYTKVIEVWSAVKDRITHLARASLKEDNPIFSMIDSGARGSWDVFTQIVGMRGLMANPQGEIIELPVKGSFREGIDVLEYFISTHGARKGMADTALRTASAGYLTRRLVDVAQDMVVMEEDCKTDEGIIFTQKESEYVGKTLSERISGRILAEDLFSDETKEVILKKGTLITTPIVRSALLGQSFSTAVIRSVLVCRAARGVCQQCYGFDLGKNKLVEMGTAVGIIAAQSIGEPGTQLTMRTFHAGGVAGQDITKGLPRVEELFEVRIPKRRAFIAEVAGKVDIITGGRTIKDKEGNIVHVSDRGQKVLSIRHEATEEEKIKVPRGASIIVEDGKKVKEGETLFTKKDGEKFISPRKGSVRVEKANLILISQVEKSEDLVIPPGYALLVRNGDLIAKGTRLTDGNLDLTQLYRLKGMQEVQKYLSHEIQYVYTSEGSSLNDKHIEVIINRLFSKVYIFDSGDTDLISGEIVDRSELRRALEEVKKKKGKEPRYDELLLGITKVSLFTDSFLSAASFQQTTRVLVGAALSGKVDRLQGLKENVIIGRLIPAGTGFKGPVERKEKN